MSIQVNNVNSTAYVTGMDGAQGVKSAAAAQTSLPEVEQLQKLLSELDLPTLPPTKSGLSVDSLFQAIGNETRKRAVAAGVNDLEVKGQEQKEAGEKELEEIKKRLEEMAKKNALSGFLKAFKIIGAVLGIVASVAGAIGSGGLGIAAAGVGIALSLETILSTATDGKVSLAAGITAIAKAAGQDDETAAKIGTWVSFGIMIVGTAATIGMGLAGAAKASAKLAEAGTNITTKISARATELSVKVSRFANIANGVNTVGIGASTIAGAVVDSNISKSHAKSKELEAILEKIRQSMEFDEAMIKAEMERSEALMDAVMDIVENCNQTNAAILTANPTMA